MYSLSLNRINHLQRATRKRNLTKLRITYETYYYIRWIGNYIAIVIIYLQIYLILVKGCFVENWTFHFHLNLFHSHFIFENKLYFLSIIIDSSSIPIYKCKTTNVNFNVNEYTHLILSRQSNMAAILMTFFYPWSPQRVHLLPFLFSFFCLNKYIR